MVGVLAESDNPQIYWQKIKEHLREEKNEMATICIHLKLKAKDGKYRLTDVVDIEGMFRIIESIPSKNAEPIKETVTKCNGLKLKTKDGKYRLTEQFKIFIKP